MFAVFALFFPVSVAIPATALVHLVNNVFKLFLVGRRADWDVIARLAVPAALAAIGDAWLLGQLTDIPVLVRYDLLGGICEVQPVKLVIGLIIVVFAVLELNPRFATHSFAPRFPVLGGLVSGFFGGLSGNQGAFRRLSF